MIGLGQFVLRLLALLFFSKECGDAVAMARAVSSSSSVCDLMDC